MARQGVLNALARSMVQAGGCSILACSSQGAPQGSGLLLQLRGLHAASHLSRCLIQPPCSGHTAAGQHSDSSNAEQLSISPKQRQEQQDQQQQQQHWQAAHPSLRSSAATRRLLPSGSSFSSSSRWPSHTPHRWISSSSSSSANAAPGPPAPDSSSSRTATQGSSTTSGNGDSAAAGTNYAGLAAKLQLPPAAVSAASATGAAVGKASKATAKQVSTLLKLIQQTSLLQATHLQLTSLWQSHSTALTTLLAAAATAGVYHLTYSAAAAFVDMSAPGAMFGCVAVSAAAVAGLGMYIKSGFVVEPERVYQVALRKLTHHAGLQEVMGTPLAGSPMRVQLVTRGSYFMQETLIPKRRAPRIHMLFPLTGPLKSGVVSLEAKKAPGGKYAFKTLMVELPSKGLAGAAGTAAATAAALRATESSSGAGSGASSSSSGGIGNSGSSSRSEEAASSSSSADTSSSSTASAAAATPAAAGMDPDGPARVYVIGGPNSSSSSDGSDSSSAAAVRCQVPAAQVLLEQLKQPLVFALQQNVVVYQTEDELEGELGYDVIPELDPEQLTLWDRAKQGSCVVVRGSMHWGKVAGCRVVQLVRKSVQTARASAAARSQAKGAAAAAVAPAAAEAAGSSQAAAAEAAGSSQAAAATNSEAAAVAAAEKEGSSGSSGSSNSLSSSARQAS